MAEATTDQVRESLAGLADTDIRQSILPTPAAPQHVELTTTAYVPEVRERYTLSRLHATGGIGRVWVAHDDGLGRDVALKEPRPEHATNPAVVSRFLKEAKITGQLEHPGIVPVYELSQRPESKQPFYTMRFVRGQTLSEAVRLYHRRNAANQAGSLELRQLLAAFVSVCNAVAYAHSRGVLHRDLKPQNVVLGDFGEVVVLDWGLARLLDEKDSEVSDLRPVSLSVEDSGQETVQGQVMGTPAYMAPEQAEGRHDLVDERTDVYGLGAILYELLTNRAPFTGNETPALLRRVIHEPVIWPRELSPAVPKPLEAVCLKALAQKPQDRYASARELGRDVECWLADDPISAHRESAPARASRWMRRHRSLVTGVAAAVLVALLSLTAATALLARANQSEKQARELAQRHAEQARDNFRLARQAVDDYSPKVSADRRLREAFQPLRRELLRSAVPFYERLAASSGDDPSVREDLARTAAKLGSITQDIDNPKKAIPYYERAMSGLKDLTAEFPERTSAWTELAGLSLALGRLRLVTGDSAGAQQDLLAAVELQRRLAAEQSTKPTPQSDLATGLTYLGDFDRTIGKVQSAEAHFQEAISLLRRLVRDHPDATAYQTKLAMTYRSLGVLYGARSRLKEQEKSYLECLKLCQRLAAEAPGDERNQENLADIQHNLGILYANQHRYREAEKAYQDALTVKRALVDKQPELISYQRELANGTDDLGTLYQFTGRLAEAEKAHRQAVVLLQRLVDRYPEVLGYHIDLAGAQMNLAQVLRKGDKAAASLEWFDRSIHSAEAVLRKEPRHDQAHEFLSIGHEGRALTLKALGRQAEAVHDLDQALEHEHGPYRTTLRAERARTIARVGNVAAARTEADDLLKRPDALHPNDLTILGYVHVILAAKTAADTHLSASERGRRVDALRAQAVALFQRAHKAGYFDDAKDRKEFLTDKELEPLRARADFQELVRGLKAMK